MAVTARGRWASSTVTATGEAVVGSVTASGEEVLSLVANDAYIGITALQTDTWAFEAELEFWVPDVHLSSVDASWIPLLQREANVGELVSADPISGNGGDLLPRDFADPELDWWAYDFHQTAFDASWIPLMIREANVTEMIPADNEYEAYQWNSGLDEDWYGNVYGFPDPAVDSSFAIFFQPPVTTDFLATQLDPSVGQDFVPEPQAEDYQNESTLDVIPQFFPPAAAVPIETFAAQPHYGDWQDWQAAEETQDYQQDPSLDVSGFLAPNQTLNNTFEGGTDGVTITVGNSGGASGDAFTAVDDPVFSNAQPEVGTLSGRFEDIGGGGPHRVRWAFTNPQSQAFSRAYYYISGLAPPTGGNYFQLQAFADTSANEDPKVVLDQDGKIVLLGFGGGILATSSVPAPQERDIRIEARLTWDGGTGGTFTARLFFTDPNATTPDETLGPIALSGATMRPSAIGGIYFGLNQGGVIWAGVYIDNVGLSTQDWLGPLGTTRTFTERPSLTNYSNGTGDPETWDEWDFQPYNDAVVEAVIAGPPAVADDSYIAALDVFDQTDFTAPDWELSPFLDQLEGFLSPNDAFDTTIATQPLAEQPWFPDQDIDTELQNDSTLDVTAATSFPPAVTEPFFAQYPLAEQPWFPDQETEEYAYEPTLDLTPFFFPSAAVAPPDTATQLDSFVGQDWLLWPDPDPTNDQPLVDGAPEIIGTNAQLQLDEPLWNKLNRAHENKGHWDDVSQGRVLRWPP